MTERVFCQEEVFLMEVNMTPDLTKTQFHPKKGPIWVQDQVLREGK